MGLEDAFLTTLLDLGGIGILAGFLMWIHVQNTRRLDAMQNKHDELLGDWRKERVGTTESLIDNIGELSNRLGGMEEKLDRALTDLSTGLKEMREHYQELKFDRLSAKGDRSKD